VKAAEQEASKQAAFAAFRSWPRCGRCGVKMMPINTSSLVYYDPVWGEYRCEAPGTRGVCTKCQEKEINERRAAAKPPPPTDLLAQRPTPAKPLPEKNPDEPKRDRFEIIEID
jgi:hypothetical protein